jgi:hypothetical protein
LNLQKNIMKIINESISWVRISVKVKIFWNNKCADAVTLTRSGRREYTATHSKQAWRDYFKATNQKNQIIAKRKNWNLNAFFASYAVFRMIFDV